jgi:hypothetical protein
MEIALERKLAGPNRNISWSVNPVQAEASRNTENGHLNNGKAKVCTRDGLDWRLSDSRYCWRLNISGDAITDGF